MLKIWNLVLIGLTYTLCLFGTFLTRSGVVQSVHAFAQTPLFASVFLGYVLVTARRLLRRCSLTPAQAAAQRAAPRVVRLARGELPAQQLGCSSRSW